LYDPWSEEILGRRFIGHDDAVWNLEVQGNDLLSTSADGTIKMWNINSAEVKASHDNEDFGRPISAQFTAESGRIVAGWTGDKLSVIDLETGK
jgi:WD40 repeat protein